MKGAGGLTSGYEVGGSAIPDLGGGRSTVDGDAITGSGGTDDSGGGNLLMQLAGGLGTLSGIGGLVGAAGGILGSLFGGNEMERKEDPYTTEGARMLRAIGDDDPEARRRQRDMSLATQQGAAVDNALNASAAQNANSGNGGDVVAGNIGAIRNSTAAVSAAGQFANARVQSDSQASTEQHDIINQKREIATALADRAKDINLINKQKSNFGSQLGNSLLGGLAGLGTGIGIAGESENAATKKKTTVKLNGIA